MTQPTPSYLADLRQGITGAFSLEELITLCSDLGGDYENLGGQGKEGRARELIAHLVRRGELARLVEYCVRERPRYPWPLDPGSAPQVTAGSGSTLAGQATGAPPPSSDATTRHLRQQLTELQGRYEALSKRIAALDTDIGRELDSERRLVLQERRSDLAAERDQVIAELTEVEMKLSGSRGAPPAAGGQPAGARPDAAQERASLERQLAEWRENLRLIEERKSQFVQETDIPLQLIKDERRVRGRITELERWLADLAALASAGAGPGHAAGEASQPAILFDEAHGQGRWFGDAPTMNKGYGRLAEIGAALAPAAVLSAGEEFSPVTLSGRRAIILPMGPQGKTQLTEAEIRAVQDFVRAGGGLLVLGAYTGDWHHEANLNRLLQEYGILFNRDVVLPPGARPDDGFLQGADRLPTSRHAVVATPADDAVGRPAARVRAALTGGVAQVSAVSACSLYVDDGAAVSVLRSSPDSVILEPVPLGVGIHIQRYLERGRAAATVLAASVRSKVVVAGSWKIFLNAFLDDPSCANQQLWRNILAWFMA